MHWLTRLALCALVGGVAGCTAAREVALVPAAVNLEADPFAARVKTFYYRRLAEQPPLPLGTGSHAYDGQTVTRE